MNYSQVAMDFKEQNPSTSFQAIHFTQLIVGHITQLTCDESTLIFSFSMHLIKHRFNRTGLWCLASAVIVLKKYIAAVF
jgi:hypothetical protein